MAQDLTLKDIEKLLAQQTAIILGAVDKRIEKSQQETGQKIDKLRNSIDKFVELYTKQEQEFTIMKSDIRKIKQVIKEKLGVNLS